MKRLKFVALLVASLAVWALAVSATAAHADPPTGADGTLTYGPPLPPGPDITEHGQTVFIEVAVDGTITGTLEGDIHEEYTVVHHARAGFNTYRGVLDFEGKVIDAEGNEHVGTLTLRTHGRQDPGMPFPTEVPWQMSWVIVGGDGELEHVQGHGTGEIVGPVLTFTTGYVHFAGH